MCYRGAEPRDNNEDDATDAIISRLSIIKMEEAEQKSEEGGVESSHFRRPPSTPPANEAGNINSTASSSTPRHTSYRVLQSLPHHKPHVKLLVAEPRPNTPTTTTTTTTAAHEGSMDNLVLIKHRSCPSPAELEDALMELAVIQLVSYTHPCPSVVPLLSYIADDARVVMIMPYVEGGDLCDVLADADGPLTEDNARRYFSDLILALLHLKYYNIAHGDVSLENVMLTTRDTEDGHPRAVLIDMGSACVVDDTLRCPLSMYSYRGKLGYLSPEVVRLRVAAAAMPSVRSEGTIDPFAIDVWAAACCLYPMLTGRPFFNDPSDVAFNRLKEEGGAQRLMEHYEMFNLMVPHQVKDLICAMLHPNPAARPTLEQILAHPWLSSPTPSLNTISSSASAGAAAGGGGAPPASTVSSLSSFSRTSSLATATTAPTPTWSSSSSLVCSPRSATSSPSQRS